jgi:hypothetical protein
LGDAITEALKNWRQTNPGGVWDIIFVDPMAIFVAYTPWLKTPLELDFALLTYNTTVE